MEAPIAPQPEPVTRGSTVANLILELTNLVQELQARRDFGEDTGAFLAERGLVAEFEAFREQRRTKR